jgi:uncharacterized protein with PIN domain
MHGKEHAIAPQLTKELGVYCFVTDQLDTDQLGTFSGEINRIDSPLEAARKKCQMAMDIASVDLAIASEGSFGPHPSIPFIPAHEEFLLVTDTKNKWEFVVRKLESNTNYRQITLNSLEPLDAFLTQVKFPTHALIVKKSEKDASVCVKGIHDKQVLLQTIEHFFSRFGQCTVETDMRAMHNETRMGVIETMTASLIQQMKTVCPACQVPGFRLQEKVRGLPCALCGKPTRSVKAEIYACQSCTYTENRPAGHKMLKEDPMYCDFCNP